MKRRRLLVVDDDARMRHTVGRILEGRHEVVCVGSAEEALALSSDEDPDVAILDVRLPGMDGFELMSRLSARSPDLDVIVMTGSLSDPDVHRIRAIREKAFHFIEKPFDRDVLTSLVDRCLELRNLREENRRHTRRLERELAQARAFQQSLYPAETCTLGALAIEARCRPCVELGGDFFDYAAAGSSRVTMLIADVSGHGASAAMITAMVKAAFQSAYVDDFRPLSVIDRIRDGIHSFTDEKFLSCICVRFDATNGVLEYVNAGHPAGLVRATNGAVRTLPPTGPIVSPVFVDLEWKDDRDVLAAGERMLIYTDGISEARNADGAMFGDERVVALLRDHGRESVVERLLADLDEYAAGRPADDDRTLLTAARSPSEP